MFRDRFQYWLSSSSWSTSNGAMSDAGQEWVIWSRWRDVGWWRCSQKWAFSLHIWNSGIPIRPSCIYKHHCQSTLTRIVVALDAELAVWVSIVSYTTSTLTVLTCCKDIRVIQLGNVIVVLKLIQSLPASSVHVRRKQVVDNVGCEGFLHKLIHQDCPWQCRGTWLGHLVGHIGEHLIVAEVDSISSNPIWIISWTHLENWA